MPMEQVDQRFFYFLILSLLSTDLLNFPFPQLFILTDAVPPFSFTMSLLSLYFTLSLSPVPHYVFHVWSNFTYFILLLNSTHGFLFYLSFHRVAIIIMISVTVVCIETGLWSLSHGAGSGSHCTRYIFFITRELILPHYLQWKPVEAHQLKS